MNIIYYMFLKYHNMENITIQQVLSLISNNKEKSYSDKLIKTCLAANYLKQKNKVSNLKYITDD